MNVDSMAHTAIGRCNDAARHHLNERRELDSYCLDNDTAITAVDVINNIKKNIINIIARRCCGRLTFVTVAILRLCDRRTRVEYSVQIFRKKTHTRSSIAKRIPQPQAVGFCASLI